MRVLATTGPDSRADSLGQRRTEGAFSRGYMMGLRVGMLYAYKDKAAVKGLIAQHDEMADLAGAPRAMDVPGMKSGLRRRLKKPAKS